MSKGIRRPRRSTVTVDFGRGSALEQLDRLRAAIQHAAPTLGIDDGRAVTRSSVIRLALEVLAERLPHLIRGGK